MRYIHSIILLFLRALPACAFAEFFEWHTTNVQLLRGWDYKLGGKARTIMTLEHANQLIVPRFLFDVGAWTDISERQLWAGMQWQYWHNKEGRKSVTESVPQLQAKWVF
ncbi:MAG: hypothetical protein AB7L92_02100 [Alphaproteobacteria bacterium]